MLKTFFLVLGGAGFCGNFKIIIEKKMDKSFEKTNIVMYLSKDLSKILALALLVIAANIWVTQTGLFIKTTAPYLNCKL